MTYILFVIIIIDGGELTNLEWQDYKVFTPGQDILNQNQTYFI